MTRDAAASVRERKPASVRRNEIMNAAAVEFAESGLAGTRLEAIAGRANISHPRVVQMFARSHRSFLRSSTRPSIALPPRFRAAAGPPRVSDGAAPLIGPATL